MCFHRGRGSAEWSTFWCSGLAAPRASGDGGRMPPLRRSRGSTPAPAPTPLRGSAFTLGTARAHDVTLERLRRRPYVRVHRCVYAELGLPLDGQQAVRAWLLALPAEAALYGPTAAAWYGLPVDAPADVQIIVPPGTVPRRRPGLEPHEGLGPDDATMHRGMRVTAPERTWVDLALTLGDVDLLVVGDAMVQRGLTTPARLVEVVGAIRGRRGIVRARTLARLVRDRVDSPQETTEVCPGPRSTRTCATTTAAGSAGPTWRTRM